MLPTRRGPTWTIQSKDENTQSLFINKVEVQQEDRLMGVGVLILVRRFKEDFSEDVILKKDLLTLNK